jgi:hydroxypyruvate isomerase
MVLLNFAAGDLSSGDRGLAGEPDRAESFRANVPVAIDLARRLGCRKLNALAGNAVSEESRPTQLGLLAESVAFAADVAAASGMSIMLEPLNPREWPRYLLPSTLAVLKLMEQVGRPNVALQFDVYHLAMAGEDPLKAIQLAGSRIGNVQLADVPGRHEPGTGVLPFEAILDALEMAGYRDPFGLEFEPSDPENPEFSCVERLGGSLSASGAEIDAAAS